MQGTWGSTYSAGEDKVVARNISTAVAAVFCRAYIHMDRPSIDASILLYAAPLGGTWYRDLSSLPSSESLPSGGFTWSISLPTSMTLTPSAIGSVTPHGPNGAGSTERALSDLTLDLSHYAAEPDWTGCLDEFMSAANACVAR